MDALRSTAEELRRPHKKYAGALGLCIRTPDAVAPLRTPCQVLFPEGVRLLATIQPA